MSASSRPEEGAAANPETKNLKDHEIVTGIPTDDKIEKNPRETNRSHKVAPMPEYSGKTLSEQSLSGGGNAPDATHGSGKGGLHHAPTRMETKKGN